jgi:hypothetical protein
LSFGRHINHEGHEGHEDEINFNFYFKVNYYED